MLNKALFVRTERNYLGSGLRLKRGVSGSAPFLFGALEFFIGTRNKKAGFPVSDFPERLRGLPEK
jgi:hypothetical protein